MTRIKNVKNVFLHLWSQRWSAELLWIFIVLVLFIMSVLFWVDLPNTSGVKIPKIYIGVSNSGLSQPNNRVTQKSKTNSSISINSFYNFEEITMLSLYRTDKHLPKGTKSETQTSTPCLRKKLCKIVLSVFRQNFHQFFL